MLGRVWAAARPRVGLPRLPAVPDGLCAAPPFRVPPLPHDPWNAREALLGGTFTFIGRTADLGLPVRWDAPAEPLLWRFNLHYHAFLDRLGPDEQVAVCRAWTEANPPGTAVAWHPYPTSLRIAEWLRAGVAERAPDLAVSLYRQAASLFRTQETYVRGNHLVENARALVLAGRAFAGQGEADRWLARGLTLIRRMTPEVVLPDGGFYERSPMYHALMLGAWLDVLNALPDTHPDAPALAATARRMNSHLASVTHPDGAIALFNDSTHEIAPEPAALHAYALRLLGHAPAVRDAFPETGLFVHRGASVFLILDGGVLGPDSLPAHGHADLFTYELSVYGRRVVTDSGVFEYAPGERRQYGRSTPAHNTVAVDGRDQAEVYGSFRVGRRFPPRDVRFASAAGESTFSGSFGGYARLLGDGIVHTRTVRAAGDTVTVEDVVTGAGRHRVESFVHLHPAVSLRLDGDRARVARDGAAGEFRASQLFGRTTGSYSPRFGVAEERAVLVLRHDGPLPARLAYTFTAAPAGTPA